MTEISNGASISGSRNQDNLLSLLSKRLDIVVIHKMLWKLPQGINLKTEGSDEQIFILKLKNRVVTFLASLK